jgi:hypothetical protein
MDFGPMGARDPDVPDRAERRVLNRDRHPMRTLDRLDPVPVMEAELSREKGGVVENH